MSDAPTEQTVEAPTPPTGRKRRFVRRWGRRAFLLAVAVAAAAILSVFTVDLGRLFPWLEPYAEQQASKFLDRPMHIGRMAARLTPGDFVFEDVVIEGRSPGDRPFFDAGRIDVHIPWWRLVLDRQLIIEVDISDWRMVVETWEGGLHNVPRLKRQSSGSKPPFTTTVNFAYARNGEFIYEDHATPWSVVARNLQFSLVRAANLQQYVGISSFHDGTVQIQHFAPMRTDMTTRFVLDGGLVHLTHIDLVTDGSESHVSGEVDFSHWPNQVYNVNSTVDFAEMRDIFFADQPWRVRGTGQFAGVFTLGKDGYRDLRGDFSSDVATIGTLAFPELHGSLLWTRDEFAVTHADSRMLGGRTRFRYGLAPLGTPRGATATFSADYTGVDLFDLDRLVNMRGLRLAGLASGSLDMAWQNGHFSTTRRGTGHTTVSPPAGTRLAPVELPDDPLPVAGESVGFDALRRPLALTVGSDLHYTFDRTGFAFDDSWVATPATWIGFSGKVASSGEAALPFRVTSHDWQESDHLLASIMTAVSGPTNAVEVGGRGTFNGEMTGTFSSPHIVGQFAGQAVRAWGVTWGPAVADVDIQSGYVTIANGLVGSRDGPFIVPNGRYALGFRRDDAEEIAAKVELHDWPMRDLRTAFQLDDWPIDGTVASAVLDLRGKYREMYGNGTVTVEPGVAWGERFATAQANVSLEGTGMLITGLRLRKSAATAGQSPGSGIVTGSARIGWDGTYAFNASSEGIPVEQIDNVALPAAPLTGRLTFNSSGAGRFDDPSYTFDGAVQDLFVGDEGIGSVSGRISIGNRRMGLDLLAASGRLLARATGTIVLDGQWTSDLDLHFQDTAIDPYLKFVLPSDISPYTRIVVAGSLAVQGPLVDAEALSLDATIDEATLTLNDYDLRNDGPIDLRFADGAFRVGSLALRGADTNLTVSGGADVTARTWDLAATGDASLSILQLFFRDLTASGGASLNAALTGPFDDPQLTGSATVSDGRLRPFDSPHSLEALNGAITLGSDGIRLRNVRGRVGAGDVTFDGNIAMDGYRVSELNLTASGRSMTLRYPDGFKSTVDMDLFLTGPLDAPRLTGSVDVLRATYVGRVQADAGLLGLSAVEPLEVSDEPLVPEAAAPGAIALDVQVTAPRMTFIDTNNARIEGRADLQVRGTFDQPQLLGSVEILGGEWVFNGNRYYVREGAIDFNDPTRLDPVFDISAETRSRSSGETFTVTVRLTGTLRRLNLQLSSDPWLPDADIITLIFGGTPNLGTAEQRALASSQELQQRMFQTAAASLLASPLTSRVGAVFERTGVVDTVQITPVLNNQNAFQQLNPSARITLGTRISPRVYLTYSRTLSSAQEEIILLEYDQNDRVSWVLSRNEDRTFALDFRLRYVF